MLWRGNCVIALELSAVTLAGAIVAFTSFSPCFVVEARYRWWFM